jgi:hypothetical protein
MKSALRITASVLVATGMLACGSTPPPPDWAVAAEGAVRRATMADLSGVQRVATVEWAIAERETARTAEPARLARLALLRCAVAQASLAGWPCPAYHVLAADADPVDQAYARYLAGQAVAADVDMLPAWHRPVAMALTQPRSAATTVMPALPEDPLARLVAVSVLWQAGWPSPQLLSAAVDTAAKQGWRRPLLAWLELQARWADEQGDTALAGQTRRRLALLQASTPAAKSSGP